MSLPGDIAESIRNQASKVLQTGQRFTRFNQVRQRHFWSTYRLYPDAAGYFESGEFDFFQVCAGQNGQGFPFELTLRETNWLGNNRVPDNENLIVTEFGLTAMIPLVATEEASPNPSVPTFALASDFCYPGLEGAFLESSVLSIKYLTNEVSLGLGSDFAQASGPLHGFYAPSMPQTMPDDASWGAPYQTNRADNRSLVTNGFPAPSLRRKLTIPILLQHGETFRMLLTLPPGRGPFAWPPAIIGQAAFSSVFALDIRLDFWATESFVE